MGSLGRLLAGVAILAIALVVAELAAGAYAQQQASQRVSAELDAPADVDIHGRPVLYWLAVGRIPSAQITAEDVPLTDSEGGGRLSTLTADLEDITVDAGELPDGQVVRDTGEGTFTAELPEEAAAELIGLPAGQVRFTGGMARLQVAGLSVDGSLRAEGGAIFIRPELPGGLSAFADVGEFRIQPDLPAAATIEDVEVGEGAVIIRGRVERSPLSDLQS